MIKLNTLNLNDKNPRNISKDAFAKLCQSVNRDPEFMRLRPIVIDEKRIIIGGNMRYRACVENGMIDVPDEWVKMARGLTAEQRKRFILIDNAPEGMAGEWDWEALGNEFDLSELDELGFDLSEIEGAGEGQDAEAQVDKAAELANEWGVKTGQVWQLGKHRIICGDCTDKGIVGRVMGQERADCVFTDPPYGVAIGDKNKFLNTFQKAGRCLENIAGDLLGKDELFDMLTKAFSLVREFSKDCCSVYLTAPQNGELGLMMMMMMIASGMPTRHVLNWIKNSPTFSMGRLDYEYQHEPILYTWTKSHKFYGAGQFKTSTWGIDKPRQSKLHPTMKPVELYENAYQNSSPKDGIIYEPFSGSGTAIIACENLSRKCHAIEISPGYVAVAIQRWADATGKKPRLIK